MPEVVPKVTALRNWILDPVLLQTIEGKLYADHKVYEALITLIQWKEMMERLAAPIEEGEDDDDGEDGGCDVDLDLEEPLWLMAETIVRLMETRPPQFLQTLDDVSKVLKQGELLTDALKARLAGERERLLPSHSAARKAYSEARGGALPDGWVPGS